MIPKDKIISCKVCGYDKNEGAHQDSMLSDYHEFEPMSSDKKECVNCGHEGKYHKKGCSIPVRNKYGKMDYCNCDDFKASHNKPNHSQQSKTSERSVARDEFGNKTADTLPGSDNPTKKHDDRKSSREECAKCGHKAEDHLNNKYLCGLCSCDKFKASHNKPNECANKDIKELIEEARKDPKVWEWIREQSSKKPKRMCELKPRV